MKAAEALRRFAEGRPIGIGDLVDDRPILILAPHPDDESLGCGGLIAAAALRSIPIFVVVMTDGTGSHPNSQAFPPSRLRAQREVELRDALTALGARQAAVTFFRCRDGYLDKDPAEQNIAVTRLVEMVRTHGIGQLFATWEGDPHPDHQATARIAKRVAAAVPSVTAYAYPIWGLTLDDDTDVPGVGPCLRLDISSALSAKRAAIAAHRSQTSGLVPDDPEGFRLSDTDIARFSGREESFAEMTADAGPDRSGSIPTEHFDRLYAGSSDPWGYDSCDYEREKYTATLAALPQRRFKRGFELGCSIGALTEMLAERCDHITGADCAAAAVELAQQRLANIPTADVLELRAPDGLPDGRWDLIVLSEVLYFFSEDDLRGLADWVLRSLEPGGLCLLVSFLGRTDTLLTGDQATERFVAALSGLVIPRTGTRTDHYRIDLLSRPQGDA